MTLSFGIKNVILFRDEQDFYFCLGYLSNLNRIAYVNKESYLNKYGIEDRIWLRNITNIPYTLKTAISDGGKYAARLNCNEYIQYITREFNFPNTDENKIPNDCKKYYLEGKNL